MSDGNVVELPLFGSSIFLFIPLSGLAHLAKQMRQLQDFARSNPISIESLERFRHQILAQSIAGGQDKWLTLAGLCLAGATGTLLVAVF